MSKEQIKIISDDARALTDNDNKMIRCHINIKHFNWLIEQAERVQELEEVLDQDARQGVLEVLYEENERLKRVLRYYADERIYDAQYKLDIMRDTGKYARKTLKEIKNESE